MNRLPLFLLLISFSACGPQSEQAELDTVPGSDLENRSALVQEDLTPAPLFELPEVGGETYRLADSRGKVVIVNFWATWCGPCVRETPAFVDLQNEWADRPFEIVGVSLDQEGFEVIRPFVDRYEIPYPMVLDDGALADEFGGVYAMPSSFIIDKEGQIVHRVVGEFPLEDLRAEMERLIDA
jgi:peroxiredoxin